MSRAIVEKKRISPSGPRWAMITCETGISVPSAPRIAVSPFHTPAREAAGVPSRADRARRNAGRFARGRMERRNGDPRRRRDGDPSLAGDHRPPGTGRGDTLLLDDRARHTRAKSLRSAPAVSDELRSADRPAEPRPARRSHLAGGCARPAREPAGGAAGPESGSLQAGQRELQPRGGRYAAAHGRRPPEERRARRRYRGPS